MNILFSKLFSQHFLRFKEIFFQGIRKFKYFILLFSSSSLNIFASDSFNLIFLNIFLNIYYIKLIQYSIIWFQFRLVKLKYGFDLF